MIAAFRRRIKAFKNFRDIAQFLGIAEQYDKDAVQHRTMIRFHQEAEMHCRTMAKAARDTARKL